MLRRCYSKNALEREPSYLGCSVTEDWKTFTNFKSWMETQDWRGKHLDKDLKFRGNKVYSPENCVFVPPEVNALVKARKKRKGNQFLGVYREKRGGKYTAQINTIDGIRWLGTFENGRAAHSAWQKAKLEAVLMQQSTCQCEKVCQLLGRVVEDLQNDIQNGLITTSL